MQAAIGEKIDNEELGGALVQCDISGVVDHRHPDDATCLEKIRSQFAQLAAGERAPFARREPVEPLYPAEDLYGIMPIDRSRPYDTHELLARLLDGSEFDEYKATYGQTLVCGTGWIGGWAVGIVANQRSIVPRKTGTGPADKELQIGGVIYSDSADKGARFVELCNQKKIPLLFLQDVTGFMVGSRAERGGIIKDGAKMVNAVANSTVPKITLFVGNSYGAGNYAMCGKAYGARFLYAWPSASIAVMGGEQASKTLLSIQLKNRGADVSEEEKRSASREIQARYAAAMNPRYAAARLWVDAIIDPAQTREVIARSLACAAMNPQSRSSGRACCRRSGAGPSDGSTGPGTGIQDYPVSHRFEDHLDLVAVGALVADQVVELDGQAVVAEGLGLLAAQDVAVDGLDLVLQGVARASPWQSFAALTGAGAVVGVPPRATILSARIWAWPSSSGISASKNCRSSIRHCPCTWLA